jgi:hypothetical protein
MTYVTQGSDGLVYSIIVDPCLTSGSALQQYIMRLVSTVLQYAKIGIQEDTW